MVNLKTYQQGREIVRLCKKIERIDKRIVVGVQVGNIFEVCKETKLKVYSQHVDSIEPGRNTGFVAAEGLRGNGAVGVMLNHSEHPLDWSVLKKSIERCKKVGLKVMVFAKDLQAARRIEKLGVDYVCIEPPELVAGKVSVSEARPELIEKIGKSLKVPFLVGAGIHSHEDVKVACKYGAVGVALSSAVTKAKDPGRVLRELIG